MEIDKEEAIFNISQALVHHKNSVIYLLNKGPFCNY